MLYFYPAVIKATPHLAVGAVSAKTEGQPPPNARTAAIFPGLRGAQSRHSSAPTASPAFFPGLAGSPDLVCLRLLL